MYAQRFGSLPIGHQTGGLAETIKAANRISDLATVDRIRPR